MKQAKIIVDKAYKISPIDQRIKGSFIEHLGTVVYGGIYQPGHPTADQYGFRNDVKELIKELGVTIIRYPGGNFVSGYNWKDGIGPKENRPSKFDPAWKVVETNEVGTDEFIRYAKEVGFEPMMAVNMGTGTPQSAQEIVDYCNGNGDTYWSKLRMQNGAKDPYGVRVWCLGNEMDGPWQICAMDADAYAKKAMEAAKIMRWTDPNIETVFCGSCATEPEHKTFGYWDRMVMERAYEEMDYISLHRYLNYDKDRPMYYPLLDDFTDVPHFFADLQDFIDMAKGAADYVKITTHSKKTLNISFDEWGLSLKQKKGHNYTQYASVDATIYGGMMITFLNNADRVKIANQSLLVNQGGLISTDPNGGAIRQASYYPFMHIAKYGNGDAIKTVVDSPMLQTNHYGEQPAIVDAVAYDEEKGEVTVFVINIGMEESVGVDYDLRSFGDLEAIEHIELYTEDPDASNTFEHPNDVVPVSLPLAIDGGHAAAELKPHSWNVLRFRVK